MKHFFKNYTVILRLMMISGTTIEIIKTKKRNKTNILNNERNKQKKNIIKDLD